MEEMLNKKTTKAFDYYELDKRYKDNTNLSNYIKQSQDFFNGDQYPNANYKNMIRVTINICKFSAVIKASKICGTPIYLTYTADNYDIDTTALREFDEYNCNKLHLDTFNYQSALNGFVNGTEITFARWDEDDTSYKGIYKGGLVLEHIDPRKFAVANPYIQSVQSQKWVMFWEDMEVGAVKELIEGRNEAEIKEKQKLIVREVAKEDSPDSEKDIDSIAHSLCRVYTRYFRINGEVYFECSTKYCDLFAFPHPLNRRLSEKVIKKVVEEYKKSINDDEPDENGGLVKDYKIDYEDIIMQQYDEKVLTEEDFKDIKEKFSLYPFSIFRPNAINGSFYGGSDVKALIPIQKGINFANSMTLKSAENNAYNKILVKPDALRGQVITNEPSQVIVDNSSQTNVWGIKMLETPPVPNGLLDFSDRLLGVTRIVYGFNDVMDGSVTNKDMSGYMLQQMIKQSNTAIEQQQQIFWVYNEEMAEVRLMFYKHYVEKAKYTSEKPDDVYDEEEEARKVLLKAKENGVKFETMPDATEEDFAKPTHKIEVKEITGEELYGVHFDISCKAMQGLADSKLVEQQMFENLFMNGQIQNIDPRWLQAYFDSNPAVSPRTRAAIRNAIAKQEKSRIAQLERQLQETQQKTLQIMAYCQQLEGINGVKSDYIKNLTAEFTGKINASNDIIKGLVKDLDRVRASNQAAISEGEKKSHNATGSNGEVPQSL
jgi:hypothetical protein